MIAFNDKTTEASSNQSYNPMANQASTEAERPKTPDPLFNAAKKIQNSLKKKTLTNSKAYTSRVATSSLLTPRPGSLNRIPVASKFNAVDLNLRRDFRMNLEPFTEAFLCDIQEIKNYRIEYNDYGDEVKQAKQQRYEACAKEIAQNFVTQQQGREWDESDVIKRINRLSEGYDDFRMQVLDDQYVKEAIDDSHLRNMMVDFADVNDTIVNCLEHQVQLSSKHLVTIPTVGATITYRSLRDNKYQDYQISIDGKPIVYIKIDKFEDDLGDHGLELNIRRAPIVHVSGGPDSPRFKKEDKSATPYKNAVFYSNGATVGSYLNIIANRLINGDFLDRNEAIDLLIDYKTLNCLPFSIEGMNGTQSKNIVKMNYLVAFVNQRFAHKIKTPIIMPYVHEDPVLMNIDSGYASPEIALVVKGPEAFRRYERETIQRLSTPDKKVTYHKR